MKVWDGTPALRPSQFLGGARRGEARALYHLAVLSECKHDDDEARRLHMKAVEVTDPGQKEWAEKSRRRLEHMPWLRAADDAHGRR